MGRKSRGKWLRRALAVKIGSLDMRYQRLFGHRREFDRARTGTK